MNCPHCGTANADQNRFCLKCGRPMASPGGAPNPMPPAQPGAAPGSPVTRMRSLGGQPSAPAPVPPQTEQRPPQAPAPAVSPPPAYPPPQAYTEQPPQPQPSQPRPPVHSPQQPAQRPHYRSTSSLPDVSTMNIWGPFAGYGARQRHIGWLMDGQGARHQELVNRIAQRFNDRRIPGVQVSQEKLTAKGVLVESRPYFLLKRGLVTLGLNVSAFGNDLFISLATYLKPPISNFRVILLGAAVLFALIGGPAIRGVLNAAIGSLTSSINPFGGNYNSGPDLSGLIMPLMCFFGPLWTLTVFGLQIGLLYSLYKWLTEKDFLALLRVKPNEFNEDDLMAMEKAVEQTVRSSLDDIGLNPADLRPAAVQGQEQRLI